jgi:hypothetical protein
MSEQNIINELISSLQKDSNLKFYLDKEYNFDIVIPRETRFKKGDQRFDIELQISSNPIAGIDIKQNINIDQNKEYSPGHVFSHVGFTFRFLIKTDGESFFIYDRFGSGKLEVFYKIGDVLKFLISAISKVENSHTDKFISLVKEKINERLEYYKEKYSYSDTTVNERVKRSFNLQGLLNSLSYNPLTNSFSFKKSNDGFKGSVEYDFISNIIDKVPNKGKIYRYTGLQTAFLSIRDKNYLVNGLMAMNDSSEVSYAEKHLFNTGTLDENTHLNRIHSINKKFITCFTEKPDDLTFWRLYAADGKGVCIEHTYDSNFHRLNQDMFVGKVSYALENGDHPELDAFWVFYAVAQAANYNFYFRNFNIWKHFFKPYDYRIEKEIRFLFNNDIENRPFEWTTHSYNVINPAVKFGLNNKELPFYVSKIYLGPSTPEKMANFHQFKAMMSPFNYGNNNLFNVDVEFSNIKHYRSV